MEGILAGFFSIETLVFSLAIWFCVLVLRRIVQALAKKSAKVIPNKWEPRFVEFWREWVLPALPIIIGGLVALGIPAYPYPEPFAATATARIFFGLVAGGASGYVYRFFKFYLQKFLPPKIKEIEEKISENALPPGDDPQE